MGGGEITYQMNALAVLDVATQMKQLSGQIGTRLGQAETFANNHMADWVDTAKTEYDTTKKEWDTAIGEMNRIIDEQAAPALTQIVNNTMDTESVNRKGWSQRVY